MTKISERFVDAFFFRQPFRRWLVFIALYLDRRNRFLTKLANWITDRLYPDNLMVSFH